MWLFLRKKPLKAGVLRGYIYSDSAVTMRAGPARRQDRPFGLEPSLLVTVKKVGHQLHILVGSVVEVREAKPGFESLQQ